MYIQFHITIYISTFISNIKGVHILYRDKGWGKLANIKSSAKKKIHIFHCLLKIFQQWNFNLAQLKVFRFNLGRCLKQGSKRLKCF